MHLVCVKCDGVFRCSFSKSKRNAGCTQVSCLLSITDSRKMPKVLIITSRFSNSFFSVVTYELELSITGSSDILVFELRFSIEKY